jgi:hypothetical protein
MSLIRFLRATRSLNGSHDKPNPYRLPQENLLPKFGSPARGRTRAQEDQKEKPLATAQTNATAMEGKERTWMFWRYWFAPKPKRTAKAPVQAELALDEVKVVRNDLADADLELVAKKPKVARGDQPAEAAAEAKYGI